jgi:hypothetical protein
MFENVTLFGQVLAISGVEWKNVNTKISCGETEMHHFKKVIGLQKWKKTRSL